MTASERVVYLLKHCCSARAINRLVDGNYFYNLMLNFNWSFRAYLLRKYQLEILNVRQVQERKRITVQYPQDCLGIYDGKVHRFYSITFQNIWLVKVLIRKYYQDSGEMNLRIKLLFDSKIGTHYLAKQTAISPSIISQTRHGHRPICQLNIVDRLSLENLYLNSKLAKNIRNFKIILPDR